MKEEKAPKHIVTVARGFKGLEQITIQLSTDDISELKDLVNKGAEAFADRNQYYQEEQEKFEAMMQKKAEEAKASKKTK